MSYYIFVKVSLQTIIIGRMCMICKILFIRQLVKQIIHVQYIILYYHNNKHF